MYICLCTLYISWGLGLVAVSCLLPNAVLLTFDSLLLLLHRAVGWLLAARIRRGEKKKTGRERAWDWREGVHPLAVCVQ